MGLHDKSIKKVYWDFVIHNPKFAIETYLYKFKYMIYVYRQVFGYWLKPLSLILLFWGILSFAVVFYNIYDLKKMFWATLCMFGASMVPLIYAYPAGHAASDHLLTLGLFALVLGFGLVNLCVMGIVTFQSKFAQQAG